jgi:hypothetical protein
MIRPSKLVLSLFLVLILAALVIWMSCEKKQAPVAPQESISLNKQLLGNKDIDAVIKIQNRHTDELLKKSGVVGTATTMLLDGGYAVKILTKDEAAGKDLPIFLEEVPVVAEVVGEIHALEFSERYRPVTVGVSGGNINDRTKKGAYIYCSGGTIGCVVYKSGKNYFLSNNHVFARQNKAAIGEDIVQPGLIDVNCSQITNDIVADLSQFVTIVLKRTANNKVDAAIAEIRPTTTFTPATECGYTPSSSVATATVGMLVKKCGRTTEYTEGQVTGVNVTVLVSYSGGTARFINQVQFSGMSDSGDSGSLIVTQSGNNPVALLFAGSTSTTIGNPIQEVINAFGVNF